MGSEEFSRLSQQVGVPQDEVSGGFAEILPEVVDQLKPEGALPSTNSGRKTRSYSRASKKLHSEGEGFTHSPVAGKDFYAGFQYVNPRFKGSILANEQRIEQ